MIKISPKAYIPFHDLHNGETLYSECKANVDVKALPFFTGIGLNHKAYPFSHATIPSDRHEPDISIKKIQEKDASKYANLNRDIRHIYEAFASGEKVRHATVTLPGVSLQYASAHAEDVHKAVLAALGHSGIGTHVCFGIDVSLDKIWHCHVLFTGSFRDPLQIYNRTGLRFHLIDDDDRSKMFNISEKNPKRIKGFHATAKYCLEKVFLTKKRYRIVKKNVV